MRALGVEVEEGGDELTVHGVGLRGLESAEIDCGNAGTLARLLPGLLAFQDGTFTLTGDESLSARPMERIAEPLRRMGAQIETTDGRLPLTITGGPLVAIDYELPVASAQVKSAILLAGLGATGRTTVVEPAPTRDHTELMLRAAGVSVSSRPTSVSIDPPESIRLGTVDVPGDFSSAAPFIVAATLVPESRITIHDVNLNPRRTGLLDVLERMGGASASSTAAASAWSRSATSRCATPELTATKITSPEVPALVDELPLFGLLAACARGESWVYGAGELRHKETDRIEALVDALRAIGVRAQGQADGFSVVGVPARPRGGRVASRGDHRIAMLGAVAGLVSREGVEIEDAESVAVCFPGFFDLLERLVQTMIVAIDGPAGAGKSTVARQARRAARLPLPRHRRDVPRAHLARDARGAAARRRRAARQLARRNPVTFDEDGRVFIAGIDVTSAIRGSRGSTAWSPSSRATTRCAR